jgi:hypothetical protein
MQKKWTRGLAALAVVASTVLLSGCYIATAPSHHPANCKKVEIKNKVCVKTSGGRCVKHKTHTKIRWDC